MARQCQENERKLKHDREAMVKHLTKEVSYNFSDFYRGDCSECSVLGSDTK